MENLRNRVDVCLVTSENTARKLFAKPNYMSRTIFLKIFNCGSYEKDKTKVEQIYLLRNEYFRLKTLMHDFHYKYIKPKYDNKAKLLFTDTDSLAYEIETKDFYKDIASDVDSMFDTSNYPKTHKSGIPTGKNKEILGMLKDECGGKQIDEFVGLGPKLYSYTVEDGVKKNVVKKKICREDHK